MTAHSGISANDELMAVLTEAKIGAFRVVHMHIDNEQIKLLGTFPANGSWRDDFERLIFPLVEPKSACYILFRLDSKNSLGYEWVLFTWIPDDAHVLQKTLYASTRSTFKRQFGDGYLSDDLLCHDKSDISLAGYQSHLDSKVAPVPLTHAEQQAAETTSDHFSRASLNDGHCSMGGIKFPLTESAEKSAREFAKGNLTYVQFRIDAAQEIIESTISKSNLKPEDISTLIPTNTGSYHLFRFSHKYNDTNLDPVIFMHAIAGYQSPIKERMLYSSCKGSLLDCLSRQLGIPIQFKLEIENFNEVTEAYLLDVVHPTETPTYLPITRPKGPSSRGPRRLIN